MKKALQIASVATTVYLVIFFIWFVMVNACVEKLIREEQGHLIATCKNNILSDIVVVVYSPVIELFTLLY